MNVTPIDDHDLKRTIARGIIADVEETGQGRIAYRELWEAEISHPKVGSWRIQTGQKPQRGWPWLGIAAFAVAAWILLEQPIAWFVAHIARHIAH